MKKCFVFIVVAVMLFAAAFPAFAGQELETRDAVGMSLVGLSTLDLYGNPVTDSIFGGYTMTVINYWATWCGPCIGEMPDFLTLYNHYQATPENDVQLWGVLMFDYSDELAEGIEMVEESGWSWGHMRKNAQLYAIAEALVGDGSVPIPQTLIVDRSGTIRAHKRGRFFDYEEMYEYVSGWYETLLAEEGPQPVIPGDVNGDGTVDVADALLCLRCAMGLVTLDENALAAADVNGDGNVDAADALMILRRAMGLIESFWRRGDRAVL